MFTKEFKVDTYVERAYCSTCGDEYKLKPRDPMEPEVSLAIWPPLPKMYDYICPTCGDTMRSEIYYPRNIYKEVENNE